MSGRTRPAAGLSLDLDDLWTYLKSHEITGWDAGRHSLLERLVPVVLEDLAALGLRATVFVTGTDAARPDRAALIRELAAAGHEIANHSFRHDTWLHRYTEPELAREVAEAESAIAAAVGVRPLGFRGPGFTWQPALFGILADRGYRYDSTVLPTFVGPVVERAFFRSARLDPEARGIRRGMFGRFRDGVRPNRPHVVSAPAGRAILEYPPTTMPIVRLPWHPTWLQLLALRSEPLAMAWHRLGVAGCRLAGRGPTVVLHPTDFLGDDLVPELSFFAPMRRPTALKRAFLGRVLAALQASFSLQPLGDRARMEAA